MTTTSPRHAGAQAAHELIVALADAGMSADRIGQVAEDMLGGLRDQPTPASREFYATFNDTAAIYVAELREVEAG